MLKKKCVKKVLITSEKCAKAILKSAEKCVKISIYLISKAFLKGVRFYWHLFCTTGSRAYS